MKGGFQWFIKNILWKLKVLYINFEYEDIKCFDANRWEQLFRQYLPQLKNIYLTYYERINYEHKILKNAGQLNQFFSSFWIERQTMVKIEIHDKYIKYVIRPHRYFFNSVLDLSLMNKNQLKLNDIWKKQGANENKLSSSISVSSSHVELNNAAGEISIVNKKLCDSSVSDEINVINQNLSINDSGNEIEEICSIPSISSRIQAEDFADEISIVDQNPCVTRLLNVVSGSSLNSCMCMSASEIEVSYSIPSISTRVQAEDFVGKINVVDQNVSIKGDINVVNQNESNSSISCDVNLINESLFNSSISVSADEIQLSSVPSTSKSLSHLHGGDLAGEVNVVHKNDNNKTHKNKDSTPTRSKHRTQYLSEWEKRPESHYRSHIFDELGQLHERSICWLYMKEKSMRCRLCEKYGKARNTN
ncbi:unnamed protein product, partial [Rotaria magnacalcarata]